jgi:hypothetical protein
LFDGEYTVEQIVHEATAGARAGEKVDEIFDHEGKDVSLFPKEG